MTNYEVIKQFGIDDFAYWMMCPYEKNEDTCDQSDCIKCTKEWLQSEYKGGE